VRIAEPIFRAFGKKRRFHGRIRTVKVYEDNVLVKQTLSQPGEGQVLVVDGGGSTRCALMGDLLATLAIDNGWAGVVIYGSIRDSAEVDQMPIGVLAVGTSPRKSRKAGEGQLDVTLRFAGVELRPGASIYADEDGLLVADRPLH
jgi:regulator of ribonuclease activity A